VETGSPKRPCSSKPLRLAAIGPEAKLPDRSGSDGSFGGTGPKSGLA
jgi:hypothetical protein